ncbi:MAG: polysaccharide deacetylase family protein [Gammaproteobacteria bacterium]|nr:polysaccharide deacetylase family protein [Gammaproteobacteria bacterium]
MRFIRHLSRLLLGLAFFSTSHAAVILQYHHINDSTPTATSIAPDIFKQHIDYIHENGFEVWSLPRLVKAIEHGEALPDKLVAITFDDGYESVATNVLPILRKRGYPFTVFVTPAMVGKHLYMDWETLKGLQAQGGTIANHTHRHPHLVRRQSGESEEEWKTRIRDELSTAEQHIQQHMGGAPGLFAYPYGEFNGTVKSIVREFGMFGFAQHSGAFDREVDRQEIPRFAFGGPYTDMQGFIEKVNSLAMPLRSVHVTDQKGRPLLEPLLPASSARPTLILELDSAELARRVSCFASGQGRIKTQVDGQTVTATVNRDLPVGRSRINCTAASSKPGRYYWHSQFFMRKHPDGSWYQEP